MWERVSVHTCMYVITDGFLKRVQVRKSSIILNRYIQAQFYSVYTMRDNTKNHDWRTDVEKGCNPEDKYSKYTPEKWTM